MEIERKWLFDTVIVSESAKLLQKVKYGQAYLSVDPEIRIRWKKRKVGEQTYKLCIKSQGTLERVKVEKDLTKEEFDKLMTIGHLTEDDFIIKDIYIYEVGGNRIDIGITDVGRDTEYIYGKMEFDSLENANAFVVPDWFGKEITNDSEYKMVNYWKRTRNK